MADHSAVTSTNKPDLASPAPISPAVRIASIDIFRGLTLLVMLFVNELSGVKGLPWWTYHMPSDVNGMTYVDMVFPAFLFIVGMSIPLALGRRLAKGDSALKLLGHVVLRSLSLVVLGFLLANRGHFDARLTGMSETAWYLAAFTGVFLLWNSYPRSVSARLVYVLKGAGLLLLVVLFAMFRSRTPQGAPAWLDLSYCEILGLIGWAYLGVASLYLLLRKRIWTLPVALVVLVALNALSTANRLPGPSGFWNIWPFEAGLCSMPMAGVVASLIFFEKGVADSLRAKARFALVYAAVLFVAGLLLLPLGVSKNHDTPTWCLFDAAADTVLFLALYWIADVRHRTNWAAFVKPAGSNTLLTYLLPDVWYSIPFLAAIGGRWGQGWPGVVWALAFTAVILGLSALLTRAKLRLQL